MAKFGRMIWTFYSNLLVTHPLLTQASTAGSLFGCGDVICQMIERYQYQKKTKAEDKENQQWNWTRIGRMATVGFFVVGPACHFWYKFLDKRIPSKLTVQVIQKILLDEFLFGPVYLSAFFVSISTLEGMTREQTIQHLRKEFWPTFKMDITVWPPAQAINFFYLPPAYRVLYISSISLFWNAYLSMVQHRD